MKMLAKNFRMQFLTGDVNYWDHGGYFISDKQNNGEMDFWYIIQVGMDSEGSDWHRPEYFAACSLVAPSQVDEKEMASCFNSMGTDLEWLDTLEAAEKERIVAGECAIYGLHAHIEWLEGTNRRELFKAARLRIYNHNMKFGFELDRPVNRIGTTGWQALAGNILGGLER